MVSFFPEPYKDEILYSLVARYHYHSKNKNLKDTLREIFHTENTIATLEFPAGLNYLESALPKELGFSSGYFINNHTIYPVYAPFLPYDRKIDVQQDLKYKNGKGIKAKVGMIAGSIGKKDSLMYCPICTQKDISIYKEAYFHRLHQVEGVVVCSEHKCFLKSYNIKQNDVSRLKFINFGHVEFDLQDVNFITDPKMLKLIDVASSVRYLLETNLANYNISEIHNKYIELLNARGLISLSGRVRQKELYAEFVSFYSEELLNKLDSCIDFNNEYNWLKVALRKSNRVTHPIRNILIILFLCGNLEGFFNKESNKSDNYRLFPCLNPACKDYRKQVIRKYNISIDSKTRERIGTFYCNCGFVYSRKMNTDIFKIGRIIVFGAIWESKLKGLITKEMLSIRKIAFILRCDSKTVVKYADKLGIKGLLNTSMDIAYKEKKEGSTRINPELYKIDVINIIRTNPSITRNQIRNKLSKQYIWLYKNNREWFEENMPKKQNSNGNNKTISWEERDNKVLEFLKNEYSLLQRNNNNLRITKSLLGRRIGMLSLLEKKLDKLPKTKEFLNDVIEGVEDFQIRRVNTVCFKINEEGEVLKKWKIVRQCGLGSNYSSKVDKQIDINIMQYNRVKHS